VHDYPTCELISQSSGCCGCPCRLGLSSKQESQCLRQKELRNESHRKLTNPFIVTAYTPCALALGWAIGAEWGHTVITAWMLFFAAVLLLLHDMAMLLAMAIAKSSSSNLR
jgi:hypothetical protein